MVDSKQLFLSLEPQFVVETARVYYQAIYGKKEDAKKDIQTFKEYALSIEDSQKAYVLEFFITAGALAQKMNEIETQYKIKALHTLAKKDTCLKEIMTRKNKKIQKIYELRDNELKDINDKKELAKKVIKRAVPVIGTFLVSRAYLSDPEAAGVALLAGSMFHVISYKVLKEKDKKEVILERYHEEELITNNDYKNEWIKIENDHMKELEEIEKEKDKREKKHFTRAEQKLMKAYEDHFGIKIEPSTVMLEESLNF